MKFELHVFLELQSAWFIAERLLRQASGLRDPVENFLLNCGAL